MSKIAIVFWSGTGNTEAMADAVESGAKDAGAEVTRFSPSDFSDARVAEFDAIAFGCPAMGAEVLEEGEMEPWASFRGTLQCDNVIEITSSPLGSPSLTLESSVSNDVEPRRQTLRSGFERTVL